jgi:hypothetical protein
VFGPFLQIGRGGGQSGRYANPVRLLSIAAKAEKIC